MTLDDFFQLALGRLYFVLGVQGRGQVVAIIRVVRRKLHRLGQAEQGVGPLAMVQQPHAQSMLQVGRFGVRSQLSGQQLTRLVSLSLFVQQFDLRYHRLQVVRLQAHCLLQGVLRLRQQGAVDVQARQLNPAFSRFGLGLQRCHEFVEHLLQWAKVQTQGIGRQAEQGVGGRKAHRLFRIVQHRAEQ